MYILFIKMSRVIQYTTLKINNYTDKTDLNGSLKLVFCFCKMFMCFAYNIKEKNDQKTLVPMVKSRFIIYIFFQFLFSSYLSKFLFTNSTLAVENMWSETGFNTDVLDMYLYYIVIIFTVTLLYTNILFLHLFSQNIKIILNKSDSIDKQMKTSNVAVNYKCTNIFSLATCIHLSLINIIVVYMSTDIAYDYCFSTIIYTIIYSMTNIMIFLLITIFYDISNKFSLINNYLQNIFDKQNQTQFNLPVNKILMSIFIICNQITRYTKFVHKTFQVIILLNIISSATSIVSTLYYTIIILINNYKNTNLIRETIIVSYCWNLYSIYKIIYIVYTIYKINKEVSVYKHNYEV